MGDVAALEGREYGPASLGIDQEKVWEFVAATGDDDSRWVSVAPPGFVANALFAVAPELLSDPAVVAAGGVIHGDQRFEWHRPLEVGITGVVSGRVARVKSRGNAVFVGFDMTWAADDGPIATGSSMFVVSGAGEVGEEVEEPAALARSETGRSASRLDLVRYAGATRDWNPIHWDHKAAVAAGLGGIVVHGLLQSAWMIQEAVRESTAPLRMARFRYREPLRPATGVTITPVGEKLELVGPDGTHLIGEFS
ncbi:MAG: hypothetical protein GEU79_11420 [Acidimicrobiia bacterium]|nr:hypothetical protein [Acidimicrobiia bacterium]